MMNSEGRSDVIMYIGNTVYVTEIKLDAPSAQAALDQIHEKGYADRFSDGRHNVVKLGINFSSRTGTLEEWVVER